MTTNHIKQIFNNNTNDGALEINDITDIAQKVKIETKIDKTSLDYYYSINVLDLAKSNITDDTLYNMVEKGWKLSKNKEQIVKYC